MELSRVAKTKKNDKSQVKMGLFEKSWKFEKTSSFFSLNLPRSLYSIAFEW